jgi:hypothetical protein
VIPPSLPTMLGSAVPTIVVSREASDMPSMSAMVTVIFAFLVMPVSARLFLEDLKPQLSKHITEHSLFQSCDALLLPEEH